MAFLTDEQKALANEIAAILIERGETVSIAEGTTGGILSAALLWVAGASKYYGGGAVVYTLNSRVQLADVPAQTLENYQGTTETMVAAMAETMRNKLGTTWCLAESGLAGPTGGRSSAPPGTTRMAVAGPVSRSQVIETDINDREANMIEFATRSLAYFRDALKDAK